MFQGGTKADQGSTLVVVTETHFIFEAWQQAAGVFNLRLHALKTRLFAPALLTKGHIMKRQKLEE
jgi:hypothetical protein